MSRNETVLNGFGTIRTESVGSTSYTTGLFHTYHPAGADSKAPGHVAFSAKIDEKGELLWRFDDSNTRARSVPADERGSETDGIPDHPKEVLAEMRRISETLEQRDPNAYFFQALGALEMESNGLWRAISAQHDTIRHLGKLLGDPREPKEHWVSAQEAGAAKGHHRPTTPEERARSREGWSDSVTKAEARLVAMAPKEIARKAMLDAMVSGLREWSRTRDNMQGMTPSQAMYAARDAHLAPSTLVVHTAKDLTRQAARLALATGPSDRQVPAAKGPASERPVLTVGVGRNSAER
jgi:hypothetical protein